MFVAAVVQSRNGEVGVGAVQIHVARCGIGTNSKDHARHPDSCTSVPESSHNSDSFRSFPSLAIPYSQRKENQLPLYERCLTRNLPWCGLHEPSMLETAHQRQNSSPYFAGNLTVNVLPAPGWLETSMPPPWASMIALQIARPRPLRPWIRERDLSAR